MGLQVYSRLSLATREATLPSKTQVGPIFSPPPERRAASHSEGSIMNLCPGKEGRSTAESRGHS